MENVNLSVIFSVILPKKPKGDIIQKVISAFLKLESDICKNKSYVIIISGPKDQDRR